MHHLLRYLRGQVVGCQDLLNLRGNVGYLARAKQQLTTLLLNAAAGYISLTEVISSDGATVSQAITYCDNIIDNPLGDYQTAQSVAATVNGGEVVAAGMIPPDTANIAYKSQAPNVASVAVAQNTPNPFNPQTTIALTSPVRTLYEVAIHDVTGKLVRALRVR